MPDDDSLNVKAGVLAILALVALAFLVLFVIIGMVRLLTWGIG